MMPAASGAQTTVYCAVDEHVPSMSGRYFTGCAVAKESELARDDGFAKKLYEYSMRVVWLEKLL